MIFAMSGRSIRIVRNVCVIGVACGLALGVIVMANGQSAGASTVRVAQGQTLTQIAREYGTTVAALTQLNNLSDPNHIEAGSLLQISGSPVAASDPSNSSGGTVTVLLGQTLSSIAAHNGVTVASLSALNGITNPNHIVAGEKLRLPVSASMATVAYVTPATSGLPSRLLAYPDRVALRPVFVHWANDEGISPALLEAMCWWESGWQISISSVTGALGVCQLEPSTVAQLQTQLGIPSLNPNVASDNIEMAAAYLRSLLQATGGDSALALAGYYQGLSSVRSVGYFLSTQQYVQGILAYVPSFS